MNWRITPSPPDRAIAPVVHRQVTGDHPQQRRLAGAVRPDQRDLGALADPERHVGEQLPPVGEGVPDPGDVDVSHGSGILPVLGRRLVARFSACTRGPESPCWLACRSTLPALLDQPAAAASPRPGAGRRPARPTPPGASRGSQRCSSACSSALPIRIGGLDQISSNRTVVRHVVRAARATRSARPGVGVGRGQLRARWLTSTA